MSFTSTETMIFDGARVQSCAKAVSCFLSLHQLSWCRSEVLAMGVWSCSSGEIQVYWPWNLGKWSACKRCRTRSSHRMVERKCRAPQSMLACVHAIPQEKGKARRSIEDSRKSRFSPHKQIWADLIWWSQRPPFSDVSQTAQLQPKITCTLNLSGCDASAISNVCLPAAFELSLPRSLSLCFVQTRSTSATSIWVVSATALKMKLRAWLRLRFLKFPVTLRGFNRFHYGTSIHFPSGQLYSYHLLMPFGSVPVLLAEPGFGRILCAGAGSLPVHSFQSCKSSQHDNGEHSAHLSHLNAMPTIWYNVTMYILQMVERNGKDI